MKISCDSCGAKYTVSDDKVQGKTVKVKCRKCSAVIVVSSTGHVTTTAGQGAASSAGSEASGPSYTVAVADGDQRNMTIPEIVAAYNEGVIDAETFLWAEGMDDWQALRDVDVIVDALHAAASQPDAGAAAAPAGDEELGRTVAMVDGAGGYPAPVAAASPRPSPSGGGVGAYQAPAPRAASPTGSSPAATASTASLASAISFGSPGTGTTAARASKPGNVGAKPTEDSAIFSLNMLTAKVGTAEEPKPNFTEEEDSGLIDLKALAGGLSSDAVLAGPLDVTGGVAGVFPLGAPPPPVAPVPMTEEEPKQGMNKLLLAGLATAVVALGAVVVFLVVRGGGTPPQQPQVVTVVQTVTVPPTPTETAPATESSADATATASGKAVAGKGGVGKGTAAKPTGTGGATPPATTAATKPKGSPCGCDPNDLMCNMRCSNRK